MGWLYFHMDEAPTKWFRERFKCSDSKLDVLDCALVNLRTIYAAMKERDTGRVFCATYLIDYDKSKYSNFGYKVIDEFCGPCTYDCPKRIFNLLTELDPKDDGYSYAKKWREKVAEFHRMKDHFKKAKGKILKTKEPIEFTSGVKLSYFMHVKNSIFYAYVELEGKLRGYGNVKISKFAENYEFEIL